MKRNPSLYQINAITFINALSARYGRHLSLATVPDAEWKSLARLGFDLIWLMGVWKRSPTARRLALQSEGLRNEYDRILPGWTEEDVAGSPYAIYDYHLEPALGTDGELAKLKSKLNGLGMGLIVDFVPNHLAMDHPWTEEHPGRFVQGRPSDVARHPDWFFPAPGSYYLAHGRDPYFAPWNDTVQVNFFSKELRQAFIDELVRISEVADGVRCDMAMLALNEIFARVWGEVLGGVSPPPTEFWDEAISNVRKHKPGFIFIAEVYWGLDRRLQEMGFDFTYDKPLYDHIVHGSAQDIADHLRSEGDFVAHQVHFIENHDEPRSAAVLGREKAMAAATIMGTVPGLRFYQHGQLEGHRIRIPVQLAREPAEPLDRPTLDFYRRFLPFSTEPALRDGQWELLPIEPAWHGNESHTNIFACQWTTETKITVVAVNYAGQRSQARIGVTLPDRVCKTLELRDLMPRISYLRDSKELREKGLYVDLAAYHSHLLTADLSQRDPPLNDGAP